MTITGSLKFSKLKHFESIDTMRPSRYVRCNGSLCLECTSVQLLLHRYYPSRRRTWWWWRWRGQWTMLCIRSECVLFCFTLHAFTCYRYTVLDDIHHELHIILVRNRLMKYFITISYLCLYTTRKWLFSQSLPLLTRGKSAIVLFGLTYFLKNKIANEY
jgi:hypothetical protein